MRIHIGIFGKRNDQYEADYPNNYNGTFAVDTIKEVKSNKDFEVKKTLDRNLLYSIKTPQGFLFNIIFSAYEKYDRHRIVTDDIEIVELYTKHKSYLVVSDKMNMKITNKSDLEYLKKLM